MLLWHNVSFRFPGLRRSTRIWLLLPYACRRGLIAEQRLRNLTGNAALSAAEVADYAKAGFKQGTPISPFSEAAWRPGAETHLHERVESICHELSGRGASLPRIAA